MLTNRFCTDKAHLDYKQLSRQYVNFYTDFLKVQVTYICGYCGGVSYTNNIGLKKFFPCEGNKSEETGWSLSSFIELVGLPYYLHLDNHNNLKEGFFKQLSKKYGIYQTFTEPHYPWHNRAKPDKGEAKAYACRLRQNMNIPFRLWCFCYGYVADLLSLLATGRFDLQGRCPYEFVMHHTPDISKYVSYIWFHWCWYFNESTKTKQLCSYLGPAH